MVKLASSVPATAMELLRSRLARKFRGTARARPRGGPDSAGMLSTRSESGHTGLAAERAAHGRDCRAGGGCHRLQGHTGVAGLAKLLLGRYVTRRDVIRAT